MTGSNGDDLLLAPDGLHVHPPATSDRQAWLTWMAEAPGCTAYAMNPVDMGEGWVLLEVDRSVVPLNPNGAVHGGLLAAIIDQAGALAILPRLEPGTAAVTATLHLDYLRPARLPLVVEARVTRLARSLIFVDIAIRSAGQLTTQARGAWVPTTAIPVAN